MAAVFWAVAPYILAEAYQRFRGVWCLHHQGDEMSMKYYHTTWRNNPKESHFHSWICLADVLRLSIPAAAYTIVKRATVDVECGSHLLESKTSDTLGRKLQ